MVAGIYIPIILWILFIPFSAKSDLAVSHLFYGETGFSHHFFWKWIYVYAQWPAWIVAIGALCFILTSYLNPLDNGKWKKPALFLVLSFALGSGLFINVLLKEYWGRPRPRQVTEFGGHHPFLAWHEPNILHQTGSVKSFPSGHASTGYYFFSLAMLGLVFRSRTLYWTGLTAAVVLGLLLSAARIAEGGHFLSDTIASAIIMWLTAYILARIMFYDTLKP